jgi:DNA-directed RNA polymerase specialized sigma24 family protein
VKIAANLALDTLKAVRREVGGTRTPAGRLAVVEQLEEGHPEDVRLSLLAHREALGRLDATVVLTRAERLGLLDQESRAVLVSVYRDGLSSREAAARHRTSPAMIRFRCSKAVRRLALHASTLSEAA